MAQKCLALFMVTQSHIGKNRNKYKILKQKKKEKHLEKTDAPGKTPYHIMDRACFPTVPWSQGSIPKRKDIGFLEIKRNYTGSLQLPDHRYIAMPSLGHEHRCWRGPSAEWISAGHIYSYPQHENKEGKHR